MPNFQWPDEGLLPRPTQNLASEVKPSLAVTEFEVGTRQRQRYTHSVETYSVSWQFNLLQYNCFETLVKHTLKSGSLPFDITLIGVDGLVRLTDVFIPGGVYRAQYSGHFFFTVSATLRKVNKPLADKDIVEFLASIVDMNPDQWVSVANILELYVENFYGSPQDSPEILDFLNLYS